MYRHPARPAKHRSLALLFTSLFGWTFVAAPLATAIAQHPDTHNRVVAASTRFRHLTASEMSNIRGAQTHTISVAAASGESYPWEGSSGGANTGNGNKTTTVPIVGWDQLNYACSY